MKYNIMNIYDEYFQYFENGPDSQFIGMSLTHLSNFQKMRINLQTICYQNNLQIYFSDS